MVETSSRHKIVRLQRKSDVSPSTDSSHSVQSSLSTSDNTCIIFDRRFPVYFAVIIHRIDFCGVDLRATVVLQSPHIIMVEWIFKFTFRRTEFKMKMRSTARTSVARPSDLLTPLYLYLILSWENIHFKRLILFLLLTHTFADSVKESVTMGIQRDTAISVSDLHSLTIATRLDSNTRHPTALNSKNFLIDITVCAEIKAAMKMVASQFQIAATQRVDLFKWLNIITLSDCQRCS